MATIGNDAESVRCIPYTGRLIVACRSDMCVPGRPGYSRDTARVTTTDVARGPLWLRLRLRSTCALGSLGLGRWLIARRDANMQGIRLANKLLRGNALQFLLDGCHTGRPFACVHRHHLHNQFLELDKDWMTEELQRCKLKRCVRWIITREQLRKGNYQGVDIGAGSGLRLAVLFWRGIASRAERGGILCLSWLEMASDTEVNQVNMSIRGQHDVSGLQVAENNGWLAHMQVFEHHAKLDADFKHFLNRQLSSLDLAKMLFQGFAFNEIHHQVPASHIGELLVDTRQVRVSQTGEQQRFTFESLGGFNEFLRAQAALAHLLDGYQSIAKLEIRSFIHSAEPPFTHLADNAVALLEQVIVGKQPRGRA